MSDMLFQVNCCLTAAQNEGHHNTVLWLLRRANSLLVQLGPELIQEELDKLPPNGTGTMQQENRRLAMETALVSIRQGLAAS